MKNRLDVALALWKKQSDCSNRIASYEPEIPISQVVGLFPDMSREILTIAGVPEILLDNLSAQLSGVPTYEDGVTIIRYSFLAAKSCEDEKAKLIRYEKRMCYINNQLEIYLNHYITINNKMRKPIEKLIEKYEALHVSTPMEVYKVLETFKSSLADIEDYYRLGYEQSPVSATDSPRKHNQIVNFRRRWIEDFIKTYLIRALGNPIINDAQRNDIERIIKIVTRFSAIYVDRSVIIERKRELLYVKQEKLLDKMQKDETY